MLDLEREEQYFIHAFNEALEREEIAEAKAAQARALDNSASKDLSLIDDFNGNYEIDERKRAYSEMHKALELYEDIYGQWRTYFELWRFNFIDENIKDAQKYSEKN